MYLPLYLALLQKCHRTELGSLSEASNHLLGTLLEDALGLGLHPLACIIEQNMYDKVDGVIKIGNAYNVVQNRTNLIYLIQ